MTDSVSSTLRRLGPCLSTELVAALVKENGLTAVNARQRVSRSTSIKKLAYLPFPRNARFVYLQEFYGSPEFWNALTRDLLDHSSSYGGGLAALLARGGMMPVAHFAIACGAPLAQKGHVSPAAVLDRLRQAGLVQTFDAPGVGQCVELSQKVAATSYDLAGMRARLRTEGILLDAIRDWARKLGLVSYGKVAVRDEGADQPRVGTFNWDLTAPSYLGALSAYTGKSVKPGFFVCDVLLGVNVSAQELQPFINKCKTLRALHKVGRCLQVFVADGYSKDAYQLAKAEGVVPATTDTLFGIEVAKALRQLTEVLTQAFPSAETFEKVDEVFKRLSHIEGAAINLRGALFEYVVAETVRLGDAHHDIQMNELLRDSSGQAAEVDVLVVHRNQTIRFIECKGYKPGGVVPDDLVDRWLENRIPLLRRAAETERFWRDSRQEFEFWTTGSLTPEAAKKIAQASARTRKYGIRLVDRDELERRVAATKSTALKRTLKAHFIEHPLQDAEAATKRIKRPLSIPKASSLPKREVSNGEALEVEDDDLDLIDIALVSPQPR